MITGTVKFYNEPRGFGFIKPDEGDRDVFVHIGQVKSSVEHLREGQRVSFDIEISERSGKPEAQDVRVI
jgi:CspA family cold shock protein